MFYGGYDGIRYKKVGWGMTLDPTYNFCSSTIQNLDTKRSQMFGATLGEFSITDPTTLKHKKLFSSGICWYYGA